MAASQSKDELERLFYEKALAPGSGTGSEVQVTNFPAQEGLTDAELRAAPVEVLDVLTAAEFLEDVVGADAVVTFNFTVARKLVYILPRGAAARAGIGQVPGLGSGIYCDDGVPTTIPVVTTSVDVYVPAGCTVTVWGLS